jgi:hypothetical protein
MTFSYIQLVNVFFSKWTYAIMETSHLYLIMDRLTR